MSDAEDALTQVGFLYTIHEVFNSTIANGVVISSTPDQATSAVQGSTVQLVVSKGPKLYLVPNVEGEQIDDAIKAIQAAGFLPEARQVLPGGPNKVLHQSHDGDEEPHGTTIVLYYF